MGFNVLAFETPLYNALTSWDAYQAKTIDFTNLMASSLHYKHWVKPGEMLPLAEHLRKGGLSLAGIDLSFYSSANEKKRCVKMVDSVESILNLQANANFKSALSQLLRDGINSRPTRDEKRSFSEHLDSMIAAFPVADLTDQMQLLRQELMGLNALGKGWWQSDPHSRKNWWSSQNMRERQMADNIVWLLSEKFKGEKIIVWAANYHISKFVNNAVEKDKYFHNDNAIPMGEFLNNKLGHEMYAIGICSYSGERTLVENEFKTTSIKPRTSLSLEYYLHHKGHNYAYVDFARRPSDLRFKIAGLFHYELEGKWGRVFDALIFIDKMKPLTIK
jgi:erythromycin esterase